ncbi:serine protease inhibitor [Cyanobium sp. HWJ4-Hawea]|uniref:serine protease inhibitor n=1 Tax=Cyanobium sp. HWJ4-Hawea TaxID=2823713 RepID=UPI0020CBEB39|nr:serine protease inhibitor [Cyanobium sp. HWJ4-Hawea]MCP9808089.1 serine protease inhibitor [Cyanobium sp. HWJ4-Hawea]
MTASAFTPTFAPVPRPSVQHHARRQRIAPVAGPALLAAVLCLVAVVVAPERPGDQAAICQRHNGVDACKVW